MIISRPGPPEVLQLRELPDPVCGPDQVRVRVRAAGLNRADLLQRRGLYPAPADSPQEIPGLEFAGEVDELGARAEGFRRGDRVMGILGGGGYAEKVCVAAGLCMPVPEALDWSQAAAIPEAFITAFDALHRQGNLQPGETLLIQAAGSGVGSAAAQLALALGARVIGLSRSEAKRRQLAELGLTRVLDPAEEALAHRIRRAAGGEVDLALNLVGASGLSVEVEALGVGGRIVVIGLLGGARAELDLSAILAKRLRISGSVLRSRDVLEKIELTREFAQRVLPLFRAARLRPVVDRCYPLAAAAEAHIRMERNENFGKIVLNVGSAS
jgi:putative PIG3 family NAD(P)H quinone oxidoreductase